MSTFLLKRKNYSTIEKIAKSKALDKLSDTVNKNKFLKDAKTFGYDLIDLGKKNKVGNKALKMAAAGALMAGTTYAIDKAITRDRKNLGIPVENIEEREDPKEKKKKRIKKALLAGGGALGTVGGTLLLARHDKLNKKTLKKAVKNLDLKGVLKPNKRELGFALGIPIAVSGIPYLITRKQLKDQINQTRRDNKEESEEEREYSSAGKKADSLLRNASKEKKGSILEKAVNFLLVPKEDREKLAKQMNKKGKWMKGLSKVVNPKNKVLNAAIGLAAFPIIFKPWELGEKATRKAISKADKEAYAYEKSQEDIVDT